MFRALWVKHWVQLRTLRWAGFGLCVVMPFFLWSGAAAAKRGWFPFTVGGYSLTTLFGEALPAFAVLLLAFLAVMFAAQAFAGDRSDGTDRFLLERPVPRTRVWQARILASLASIVWVSLGNAAYMLALVSIVNDGSVAGVFRNILMWVAAGLGLAVLGILGGMAAGEMAQTPMQGVMIGVVLAALPIGAVMFLASVFQFVLIKDAVHLAYVLAPILPLALILASYRAGCLGEPSGNGRIKRGLVVLVVAVVLTPALFAAAAPWVLRSAVQGGWPQGIAGGADRAVVIDGGYRENGGWMIDTAAGSRTRFLPPPVRSTAYKADGSLLAVINEWGILGSVGPVKLDLIDSSGRSVHSFPLEMDLDTYSRSVHWAGDRVLVLEWVGSTGGRIQVIDPTRGLLGAIAVDVARGQSWSVHGPTTDGAVYLHRLVGQDPRRYELSRLDLEGFTVEEPLLIEDDDLPTFARKRLSPSGRYWARMVYAEDVFTSYMLDLQTGERVDFPLGVIAGWLSGDRLVRIERDGDGVRVVVEHAAGGEVLARSFPRGAGAIISPDRERFFVALSGSGTRHFSYPFYFGGDRSPVTELFICDGTRWTELDSLVGGVADRYTILNWGGPNTLLATQENATAVADAKPGARWKPVIGNWE